MELQGKALKAICLSAFACAAAGNSRLSIGQNSDSRFSEVVLPPLPAGTLFNNVGVVNDDQTLRLPTDCGVDPLANSPRRPIVITRSEDPLPRLQRLFREELHNSRAEVRLRRNTLNISNLNYQICTSNTATNRQVIAQRILNDAFTSGATTDAHEPSIAWTSVGEQTDLYGNTVEVFQLYFCAHPIWGAFAKVTISSNVMVEEIQAPALTDQDLISLQSVRETPMPDSSEWPAILQRVDPTIHIALGRRDSVAYMRSVDNQFTKVLVLTAEHSSITASANGAKKTVLASFVVDPSTEKVIAAEGWKIDTQNIAPTRATPTVAHELNEIARLVHAPGMDNLPRDIVVSCAPTCQLTATVNLAAKTEDPQNVSAAVFLGTSPTPVAASAGEQFVQDSDPDQTHKRLQRVAVEAYADLWKIIKILKTVANYCGFDNKCGPDNGLLVRIKPDSHIVGQHTPDYLEFGKSPTQPYYGAENLPIVAHEYTHGIIHQHLPLQSVVDLDVCAADPDQPFLTIDESVADLTGLLITADLTPTSTNIQSIIGENVLGEDKRNLSSPVRITDRAALIAAAANSDEDLKRAWQAQQFAQPTTADELINPPCNTSTLPTYKNTLKYINTGVTNKVLYEVVNMPKSFRPPEFQADRKWLELMTRIFVGTASELRCPDAGDCDNYCNLFYKMMAAIEHESFTFTHKRELQKEVSKILATSKLFLTCSGGS